MDNLELRNTMTPCNIHYSNASYPITKKCTFERTFTGIPLHCENTEHLQRCLHFNCPTQYKCPQSYCVPMSYVCDQVNDCPKGEDEMGCDYLRYGKTNVKGRFDSPAISNHFTKK